VTKNKTETNLIWYLCWCLCKFLRLVCSSHQYLVAL